MMLVLTQASRPDRLSQFFKDNPDLQDQVFPFFSVPHAEPFKSFCLSQHAMLRAWYYSTSDSDQFGLFFEDDCILTGKIIFPQVDFDIVYYGCNLNGQKPVGSGDWNFMESRDGVFMTHCVGYKRSAVKKIIDTYNPSLNWQMYDDWLREQVLEGKFKALIANPMIAWQRPCKSDLWGQHTDYTYTIESGNQLMQQ